MIFYPCKLSTPPPPIVVDNGVTTESGYALDARQANPNIEESLGYNINKNSTQISINAGKIDDIEYTINNQMIKNNGRNGYPGFYRMFTLDFSKFNKTSLESDDIDLFMFNYYSYITYFNTSNSQSSKYFCGRAFIRLRSDFMKISHFNYTSNISDLSRIGNVTSGPQSILLYRQTDSMRYDIYLFKDYSLPSYVIIDLPLLYAMKDCYIYRNDVGESVTGVEGLSGYFIPKSLSCVYATKI